MGPEADRPMAAQRPKRKSTRGRPRRRPAPPAKRRDDRGSLWTLSEVEAEILAVIARLDAKAREPEVTRATRFARDLGWDEWFKLSLLKPVKRRLHETLSAAVVLDRVKTVGDLVDYVWSSMEVR